MAYICKSLSLKSHLTYNQTLSHWFNQPISSLSQNYLFFEILKCQYNLLSTYKLTHWASSTIISYDNLFYFWNDIRVIEYPCDWIHLTNSWEQDSYFVSALTWYLLCASIVLWSKVIISQRAFSLLGKTSIINLWIKHYA